MAKDLSAMANNNKSYMAKPGEVESKWYVVDATDMVLGRLNCDKVVLTGKKLEQKYYRYHTGYIGGLKEVQYKKLMNEKPEFAVYKAVKGMLPKNSLGRDMLKKLRVYAGSEHNHQAQCPVALDLK